MIRLKPHGHFRGAQPHALGDVYELRCEKEAAFEQLRCDPAEELAVHKERSLRVANPRTEDEPPQEAEACSQHSACHTTFDFGLWASFGPDDDGWHLPALRSRETVCSIEVVESEGQIIGRQEHRRSTTEARTHSQRISHTSRTL